MIYCFVGFDCGLLFVFDCFAFCLIYFGQVCDLIDVILWVLFGLTTCGLDCLILFCDVWFACLGCLFPCS